MSFPSVLTQKGHWSIKITNGLLGLRQQRLSESHEIDTLMYKDTISPFWHLQISSKKHSKHTHFETLYNLSISYISDFSKKNPQLDPPVFPAARGLTWNRPMSPTPTSTAAGNEAIGPSIRAPGVFCPVQKILTFLLRLFKKSLFLRKKSQVKKESHQKWTLMTIKTSFLHWLHLKRFKRACVAETPGATSLHRVGSFTCFFAR